MLKVIYLLYFRSARSGNNGIELKHRSPNVKGAIYMLDFRSAGSGTLVRTFAWSPNVKGVFAVNNLKRV